MRDFDVVVFGATGFAGKLVAEYFAKSYGDSVRWAIAGRSLEKLEAVKAELIELDDSCKDLELIVADSLDRDSLEAMAKRTTVVCTTVGPYAKYGALLVEVCVDTNTHYCDLTGETQFIRRNLDAGWHSVAQRNGTRIVHCCGYDSIPSDIGTFIVQEHCIESEGKPRPEVVTFAWAAKGGFSGGTVASIMNIVDEATEDRDVRRMVGHPYGLNPPDKREGPDGSDDMGVGQDPDVGWTAPFLMAPINTRIVRRSNALMDYRYGKNMTYREVMKAGKGAKGLAQATAITAAIASFTAGLVTPGVRGVLENFLPDPGEGPSRDDIENGFFDTRIYARRPGKDPVIGRIYLDLDPGYGGTAVMLAESAIVLALHQDELPSEGGVLTPSSAMGQVLVDRLKDAGMKIEIKQAA